MVFLRKIQSQVLAGQPQVSPWQEGHTAGAVWDEGDPKDSALGWRSRDSKGLCSP